MAVINDIQALKQHLRSSYHIPKNFNTPGWDDLEFSSASYNRDNPNAKTSFLRNTPWEEVKKLIVTTVSSTTAHRYNQPHGTIVAIHKFPRVIGEKIVFRNGVNDLNGYHKIYCQRLKVVYTVYSPTNFEVITAYPVH